MRLRFSETAEVVKEVESSGSFKWPIALILMLICAVTGFAYWKRKRSQMNFKNLANSHYNTRSGSTTFSGVNGLGKKFLALKSPAERTY